MTAKSDKAVHPLDAIAAKFNQVPSSFRDTNSSDAESTGAITLTLAASLPSPALILSKQLQIAWQNDLAKNQIWRQLPDPQDSHMDVFDLLLSVHFQSTVGNWRQWVAFFIQQALALISKEALGKYFDEKEDHHAEVLAGMLTDFEAGEENQISNGTLPQRLTDDQTTAYQVIGMTFNQGRLLIFQTLSFGDRQQGMSPGLPSLLSPSMLRTAQSYPAKLSFFILGAHLDHAETLSKEMLAKDFNDLLNQMWGLTKATIESHEGLFSLNNTGTAFGYFTVTADTKGRQPLNVIQCALALKAHMKDLGRQWKIKMGWLHDIDLNIGIHHGTEYVTSISSSQGDTLLPWGGTLDLADRLATLSHSGQIWTTKTVMDQIADDEINNIKFGIFRNDGSRQVFIPNYFSRIRDLTGLNLPAFSGDDDYGLHLVTLIFDYQS